MTTHSEIWDTIQQYMRRKRWVSLQEIYGLVAERIVLDTEDYEPQSPSSEVPKWQRNVRNVLQYRKRTGDIEWDENSHYRL